MTTVDRGKIKSFFVGILIVTIILLPAIWNRPVFLINSESVYMKDVVTYNSYYSQLTGEVGRGNSNSFLMIFSATITVGGSFMVAVSFENNVTINAIVVIVGGDDYEILDLLFDVEENYNEVFKIEQYGSYKVVVFGDNDGDEHSVVISLLVLV